MNETNKKTTQDRPEGARVVFRFFSGLVDRLAAIFAAVLRPLAAGDERMWRLLAAWSVIVFVMTAGAGAIIWTLVDGRAATELSGFFGRYRDRGQVAIENPEPAVRRALDGKPLDAATAEALPFAVSIDNMIDARPQSGLTEAAVVIESPVEGGITRFLAIFPGDAKTAKIGPVRSARPYFIDWAREYDAVFVHVGGSPEALEKISTTAVRDFNEYSRGGFFWRDKARKAPHNVYTSGEQLAAAAAKLWPEPAKALAAWKFENDRPLSERPGNVADLEISSSVNDAYGRSWRYDRQADDYVRLQAGGEFLDQDGNVVRAKNVVVQFAEVVILDEVGRRRIGTVGKGDALVASGGRVVKGSWIKESAGGRTKFLAEDGTEAVFHAGITWIQVVPKGTKLVYE